MKEQFLQDPNQAIHFQKVQPNKKNWLSAEQWIRSMNLETNQLNWIKFLKNEI